MATRSAKSTNVQWSDPIALIRRLVVAALLAFGVACPSWGAPITLASAQMGPGGQPLGPSLSANNFVGWRFTLAKSLAVTEVGGHVGGNGAALFAAIVKLTAIDALPVGAPFDAATVIKSTTFMPPVASADVRIPLVTTLTPGAYAVVFGSGLFGATGSGLISNAQQTNIAPTTKTSYIAWRQTLPGVFNWTVGSPNNVRLVISGNEFAGATDFNLDGRVDALDLSVWKGGFGGPATGGTASGDADLDGDVDGVDFLMWQRTLSPPATTATSIPEPPAATGLLTFTATVTLFCRLRRRN